MKKLSKNEWVAVGASLVLVGYTLFGSQVGSLFKKTTNQNMQEEAKESLQAEVDAAREVAAAAQSKPQSNATMNDIIISDSVVGTGVVAVSGKVISVNYLLALSDGTVIQNSKDFGAPFSFVLGAGQVIQGWEKGFTGMKVGGVRTIVVPPSLGYGAQAVGPIPANSTLVFTVELLGVSDLPVQ